MYRQTTQGGLRAGYALGAAAQPIAGASRARLTAAFGPPDGRPPVWLFLGPDAALYAVRQEDKAFVARTSQAEPGALDAFVAHVRTRLREAAGL